MAAAAAASIFTFHSQPPPTTSPLLPGERPLCSSHCLFDSGSPELLSFPPLRPPPLPLTKLREGKMFDKDLQRRQVNISAEPNLEELLSLCWDHLCNYSCSSTFSFLPNARGIFKQVILFFCARLPHLRASNVLNIMHFQEIQVTSPTASS